MKPRKMGFVVDKVSEDSFYENLLLGISKILDKSPFVNNVTLKRIPGVRQIDIRSWEHNNGVILPEDLRSFYSSTNGFSYTYGFSYDKNGTSSTALRTGKISVNPINELKRILGYEVKTVAHVDKAFNKLKLSLSRESKVFELCDVDDQCKVVLVYITAYSVPTIWLCDLLTMCFDYLSEDFTLYFRMCIAHLGAPAWQHVASRDGVPDWAGEIFRLIAPGVLREDRNLVDRPRFDDQIVNRIDPSIFAAYSPTVAVSQAETHQAQAQFGRQRERKPKAPPKRHISAKQPKKATP